MKSTPRQRSWYWYDWANSAYITTTATVLIGLNRMWNLGWTRAQLLPLALKLGADVPFFLGQGPAWVEGIGEQMTPIELAPTRFAVVKPPASLPTKCRVPRRLQ